MTDQTDLQTLLEIEKNPDANQNDDTSEVDSAEFGSSTQARPLADILRPASLEEVIGQNHLVGENRPLTKLVEQRQLFSIIFWGPPGVGKTTLARILARETGREFFEISAVAAGKKDLREVVENAQAKQRQLPTSLAPVLFIDEIHRFNKAQQDYLLPYVENGVIILIGATTENPSFEVISALLSRCRVFTLKPLEKNDLKELVAKAVEYFQKYKPSLQIEADASDWIIQMSAGDARHVLTLLDHAFALYRDFSLENLLATSEKKRLSYDKAGENHYNTISAFIKSMRASSPDAALYYLARMVEAGESPTFIARRMVIFASEDIGLAQPTALVVANAVFDAVTKVGFPEAGINLAHGVAYLARAKKDRSAYDAYQAALADAAKYGDLPIPKAILNAPTSLMKAEGYGQGYSMYELKTDQLLPEELKGRRFFEEDN